MDASAPRILRAADGPAMGDPAGVRDRFMVDGEDAGGRFALVQHLFAPRALAAPLHRHHREERVLLRALRTHRRRPRGRRGGRGTR